MCQGLREKGSGERISAGNEHILEMVVGGGLTAK
jgi:hypothetical protein